MNKTAIKNFAIWARNKLIADVRFQAQMVGIMEDGIGEPLSQSDEHVQFFDIGTRDYATVRGDDIPRRNALAYEIREKALHSNYESAYRTVTEKVAYTWFNRLIAIRFMEVNDYLPGRVRILSSRFEGKAEPDIVSEPFESDLAFSDEDREQIQRMKDDNHLDELFRFLFIRECEALGGILPGLFENRDGTWSKRDYYNLLLSINFTDRDGIVWHLVHDIPESDFRVRTAEDELRQRAEGIPEEAMPAGQVNIIGWLYQYYITELNEIVYDGNMSKSRIPKELIPAATTIYTPDWPVRYMVENSLGRLWLEGHPNDALKSNWCYYLAEAEQEPEVQAKLDEMRAGYAKLSPEEIKVIDPCCGSGHIAVYMFDVLMQIYESQGWTRRDAVRSILENNLYALDIDDRAAQLAYFAVMMKAREYDRRFLTRTNDGGYPDIPQPKVYGIIESAPIPEEAWDYFGPEKELAQHIYEQFAEAKTLGSTIQVNVSAEQLSALRARLEEMDRMADYGSLPVQALVGTVCSVMLPLVEQVEIFAQKYDVVVTNPPYLGSSRFTNVLDKYVKDHYDDVKSDLCTVMYKRALEGFVKSSGFVAFITTSSWMFLSSFEKLRKAVAETASITNLVDFGTELFDGKVGHNPIVAWVTRKVKLNYAMTAIRLVDYCYARREEKEPEFFKERNRYIAYQDNFSKIPGAPVAYWVEDKIYHVYDNNLVRSYGRARSGLQTSDNNRFLRFWFEVSISNISFSCASRAESKSLKQKWYPHPKGGDFRKWYGNLEYVINWQFDGKELFDFAAMLYGSPTRIIKNTEYYFKPCISWSHTTSKKQLAVRYIKGGMIFNVEAPSIFELEDPIYFIGLLNSVIATTFIKITNQTLHFQSGDVERIPVVYRPTSQISDLVTTNIALSEADWDSFETSWDFQEHPLVRWSKDIWDKTSIACAMSYYYGNRPEIHSPLEECFLLWQGECQDRFNKLKSNEEELNRIFIDIYGLQDELSPEVEDRDVTIRRADLGRDIRSLISYAVGCMFGRYSLDQEGLILAGQPFNDKFVYASVPVSGTGHTGANDSMMRRGDCYLRMGDKIKKSSFAPDSDNCIPITDEAYFEDDIVGRLEEFLRVVYGGETLEQNLDFIASALGNRGGTSREIIRNYFLNDFYKDHLKTYQKRPIYWLFDSGKQNGFKALVYMHRWNADTAGNVRMEYLYRMQRVYEHEIVRMKDTADNTPDPREANRAIKRGEKLAKQLKEIQAYDERLGHVANVRPTIDLDDGVKVNYEKVQLGPEGRSLEILANI